MQSQEKFIIYILFNIFRGSSFVVFLCFFLLGDSVEFSELEHYNETSRIQKRAS